MRTGAAAGHRGYFHETALYDSDEDFLAIVVPFMEGALEAGEPTVVALSEMNEKLVRGGAGFVEPVIRRRSVHRPASTIKAYREVPRPTPTRRH